MSDTSIIELPSGWMTRELREIVEVLDSRRKPVNSKERATRVGVVPYYGAAGQVGTIDKALFDEDLVLLGEDGVQFFDPDKHKAYEISGPAWVNNHAHVLRCRGNIMSQRLLVHYLNQFDYRNRANGTTRLKLTQAAMNDIPVLVPPLTEQEKIVEILEEQLSRLDAALASVRTVREKAAQFRRSLLHAAFIGALTGHDPSLGTPLAVRVKTEINQVAHINYGYTESATRDSIGPKFLRITDIQDGRVSWSEVPYCTISEKDEEKHRLASGDIVFARTGATTGKSFLVINPPNAVCASYLIRLRPMADKVLPEFLNAYFQSDTYWNQIRTGTTGTAQGGFNASKLAKLIVVLPSLAEQEEIVEILEEQLSRLDASLVAADAVEKRAATLRRSLLHTAFTGKLTEQWREGSHV